MTKRDGERKMKNGNIENITTSMVHNQDDNGNWRVDLCISGIPNENIAQGFLIMLQDLLCGDEIKVN